MRYKILSRSNPPVSLAEAKAHLRVTHNLEDDLIQGIVDASIEWAELYTGMAFGINVVEAISEVNTTEYYLERYLPIDTIDSVVDADGTPIAFTYIYPCAIVLDEEVTAYPVTITYTTSIINLPSPAKMAMLLKIGDLYDYRTDRGIPLSQDGQYRSVAEMLLQPYKLPLFSP